MKIKDQKGWDDWIEKQGDSAYSLRCFSYAEDWADLMEVAMSEGKELEDVAEKLSHVADTDGITGFMYGASVGILSLHWEHGEQLRQWHNLDTQVGTEGEKANKDGGVLNPALITISLPK